MILSSKHYIILDGGRNQRESSLSAQSALAVPHDRCPPADCQNQNQYFLYLLCVLACDISDLFHFTDDEIENLNIWVEVTWSDSSRTGGLSKEP